jgi:tetratricopeptide (TPR) repeat protein
MSVPIVDPTSRPSASGGSSEADAETKPVIEAPSERPGRTTAAIGLSLGRYVVLEEIGQGGMGRVLRAYDPRLQREVALKEVRHALLGSRGATRLVGEARAMAKLSHPNVVAIFDVEALDDGEVMLVMEYVAGCTLRDWLEQSDRSWTAIVARFIAAGRGLAAAHEAGLLHRDFKPTNVLIGDDGTVKVTDFGLAQGVDASTDSEPGDADLGGTGTLTESGVVMGTPRYMAPEQHRGDQLTAAADQYAFCVALWEALEGQPPFVGKDLARRKREGPPAWSTAGIPRPVADAIRRGLAPDPSERWPSMTALLEALSYDPARRRRRWLAAVSTVALGGVIAGSAAAWSDARAKQCSGAAEQLASVWGPQRRGEIEAAVVAVGVPYATTVWERTAARLDAYADAWTAMHVETCEATTVRGEQSEAVMDLRMACLHRAKDELEAVAGVFASADAGVVQKAHEVVGQVRPLERCADVEALQADVEPPDPADAEGVEAVRARLARVRAELAAGRYASAKEEVVAARQAANPIAYGPLQTEVALEEGLVFDALGEDEAAVRTFDEVLESAGRWGQRRLMAAASARLLYLVGHRQQRPEEGLRYATLARGLARDPAEEAAVSGALTSIYATQGKYEEAVAEARRALALNEEAFGPDHPTVATSRSHVGNVLGDLAKHAEAEVEHRKALAILEKAVGSEHPDIAMARDNLGTALYHLGRDDEAVAEHRKAAELEEKTLGPDHPRVAMSLNNIGNVLRARGDNEEAQVVLHRALAVFEKTLGPDHPFVGQSQTNLARTLIELGRPEEALPLAETAWTRRQGDEVPPELRGDTAFVLAQALWETKKDRARARSLAERAAADFRTPDGRHDDLLAIIEAWIRDHPQ